MKLCLLHRLIGLAKARVRRVPMQCACSALALSVFSQRRRSTLVLSGLNLVGGACLGVSTVASNSWPSAVTNIVWCASAAGGLVAGFEVARSAGPFRTGIASLRGGCGDGVRRRCN